MDVGPLVARLLLGAGIAAQLGYWFGKRRITLDRSASDAVAEPSQTVDEIELPPETRTTKDSFANVAARLNALEGALDELDELTSPPDSDFT